MSSLLPTTGALKAYDKAIEIRRKAAAAPKAGSTEDGGTEGGQLSARLLNNAAVLHLRAGDAQKAYDLMAQAVAAAAGGAATDLDPLSQVGQWGVGGGEWPCKGLSPHLVSRALHRLCHVCLERSSPVHHLVSVQVTLGYNLARVKEACGDLKVGCCCCGPSNGWDDSCLLLP